MPADGISLPPKKDFGMSRWGGSKVRLHQRRHWAEGGMTACGTPPNQSECGGMFAPGGITRFFIILAS
jgi:hypothetical protein